VLNSLGVEKFSEAYALFSNPPFILTDASETLERLSRLRGLRV